MLALLVLAAWVWWGFALYRLCGLRLRGEERLVVAPVLGLVTGAWIVYLLASAHGRLSSGVLVVSVGLFALGGLAARLRPRPETGGVEPWFWWTAASVTAVLGAMNLYGVLAPGRDGPLAAEHIWADLPFHLSIVSTFAHGENFPPAHPVAYGEPLTYPFLVDFVSAVFVSGGLGLRGGIVLGNLLVQVAFFCAVALVAYRLTRSRRAAVLSVGVLFCLGNLGWLAVPGDIADAGGLVPWLSELPWSYTGDALGGPGRDRLGIGVYLGNPTFIFFLPRRAGAFGLAVGAVLLLLLWDLLRRRHVGTAVAAGLLLGLLPRIHAHSVIAMLAFVAVWCALLPALEGARSVRAWMRAWRDALGTWALVGAIALALGVPQVLAMTEHTEGFFAWAPGWIGEPLEAAGVGAFAWSMAGFWIVNAGVLLLLAVPAWRRAEVQMRVWYAPFVVLWLFGNLVRTQPWEWDNNNYFVYWQLGTVVLVAPYVAGFLRRKASSVRLAVGAVLVAVLTFGGLLSFLYAAQARHHLWTPEEAAFAQDLRDHVPVGEPVLTANGHTHPVIALSGRQVFMGFTGWLSTHGLDWASYEEDLTRMYAGDLDVLRAYGFRYVVLGPWEEGLAHGRDIELAEAFHDPTVFDEVERRLIAGRQWRLLRVR